MEGREVYTVLLIEDDEIDRMGIQRALANCGAGINFILASTLASARRLLGRERVDAVILDHELPDGVGLDLLPLLDRRPAILVTGRGSESLAAECLNSGAAGYLSKDVESRYLDRLPGLLLKALESPAGRDGFRIRSCLDQHAIVAVTDAAGRITYANSKFLAISGYSLSELLGRDHRILNSGLHPKAFFRELWSTVRSGRAWRGEIRNRAKDGSFYWVDTTIVPFLDASGKVSELVSIRTDITGMKSLSERLAREKAEAEALRDSKSRCLAHLSHELRTPIGGILGTADLLRDMPMDPEAGAYVETLHSSAQHLLSLVNDLLDHSRIEAGMMPIESLPFSVRPIIQAVLDAFGPPAIAKGVELAAMASPEVPATLLGDPTRIRQVVFNLAGNAVKFTDSGHVRIRFRWRADAGARGQLFVDIEDSGIGIPPERMAGIFDAFAQAESSTSRRFGGTGLGLSISRNLARLMGGDLVAASLPGEGSTFTLSIPSEAVSGSESILAWFRGLRGQPLLIVGPGRKSMEAIRECLDALEADHAQANGLEDALRLAGRRASEGRPFRLAVLDLEMDVEGLKAWKRRLDGLSPAPRMQLLYLAPRALPGLSGRLARAGFGGCLAHPVSPFKVLACLKRMAAQAPGDRQGRFITLRTLLAGTAEAAGNRPGPRGPRTLRILLADDNPVNRLIAGDLLRRLGCTVVEAVDGMQALSSALDKPFDLILMDCEMPGLDGYQATRQIRMREGRGRRIPIVAFTANALEGDRQRCLDAGMDDYLPKPVTRDSLRSLLERLAE